MKVFSWSLFLLLAFVTIFPLAYGQEAQRRWEYMNQIRREKFDLVLPEVMRENRIDMWITVGREGYEEPMAVDLGDAYMGDIGYYIFTDRGGDRIERAALAVSDYLLTENGAYDIITGDFDLRAFVAERDPQTIALNYSKYIAGADGLTYNHYQQLVEVLGEPYVSRFVSSEKLVSDFRSRRVASEIAAFAQLGDISRRIAERALSNEVITPGVTTLEDVAWWMKEQLHANNLESSFGMPSVYLQMPGVDPSVSSSRIIQRGDAIAIDWGAGYMNFFTDVKRYAYVLKEGETTIPPGLQKAFDNARAVRDILKANIKVGRRADETEAFLKQKLDEAGFSVMAAPNQPSDDPEKIDVIIGCHSVGNVGHGSGPSIAWFHPRRASFVIQPTNLLAIELFAYTSVPEWGGGKARIPLEDDAIVTHRGVEWLYPVNDRVLLIK
jgi:Xaa-Pro aminopeptidase